MLSEEQRYVGLNKAVPFEISETRVPEGPTNHTNGAGHYNVNFEYISGLSKPLTVIDRNGMRIELPPTIQASDTGLTVRVRISMGREVKVNVDALLNSSSPATNMLGQVIVEGYAKERFGQYHYELDYLIGLDAIEKNGGSLYLQNLDIVVSVMQDHLIPHHPNSEVGVRNRLVEEDETINNPASFGYSLRIVDSMGIFGDRYVNVHGQVYKVPCVRQSSLPDGVYLTSSGPVETESTFNKPVSKRFSFQEADAHLKLYDSIQAAKTHGDEIGQREKELRELTVNLKEKEQRLKDERIEREHEFDKLKVQMDREKAEEEANRKQEESRVQQRVAKLKEEIAELEHKRSVEMLQRKDVYETRSMERKDSQEIVKFLPTLISGALAAFMVFSKFG